MKNVISVENARQSDKATIESGITGIELVKRASQAIYDSYHFYGMVAVVCGSGNNAADGYALSLLLKDNGINPIIFRCNDKASEEGKFYLEECIKKGIAIKYIDSYTNLEDFDIVVDCIFGTGFNKEVNDFYRMIIDKINKSSAYIISVDINSGLNGNNGLANAAVKSNLTISIGDYKYGHFLNQAKDYIASSVSKDIGIKSIVEEAYLLENSDIKQILKPRLNFTNKGSYGYVGIIGGSCNYPGAVKLAYLGQNALYSGAGVSRIIVPKLMVKDVRDNILEATAYPFPNDEAGNLIYDELELSKAIKGLKAIGIGVGIGVSDDIKKILSYLILNYEGRLIIDADGLNNLSEMDMSILNNTKASIILTPHLKELSRLTGYTVADIQKNSIGVGVELSKKYNVCVLIKGPTTIVVDNEEIYMVNRGTPGMATAGSGDVLTGVLTGMMGYMDESRALATATAAYINGAAGELAEEEYGSYGMVASDTARAVSKVIAKLSN